MFGHRCHELREKMVNPLLYHDTKNDLCKQEKLLSAKQIHHLYP